MKLVKETFKEFWSKRFIKQKGHYVPTTYMNEYRHFGIKKNRNFYLSELEVLYLYYSKYKESLSIQTLDPRTRAYFHLKHNNYNLIENDGEIDLYEKRKDFNRDNDKAIGKVVVKSYDEVYTFTKRKSPVITVIHSPDKICFLKFTSFSLSEINPKEKPHPDIKK